MNLETWQERVLNKAFLKPFIGEELLSLKSDGENLCFSFINKVNGQERQVILSGSTADMSDVLGGKRRLSDCIKNQKLSFSGTYREQLRLESLLFLCRPLT